MASPAARRSQVTPRRGRPRLGNYRVSCIVPKAVKDELLRREAVTGTARTRIAAQILSAELIGGVTNQGNG